MHRAASVVFALVSLASPLAAQAHPDFSGKWALDTATAQAPMAPQSMTLVVTQDATTLKIESTATSQMGEQKGTTVLNLDGSQSKYTMATPNGSLDLQSTATWDGSALVVTTNAEIQGQALEQKDRWSMDPAGKTLHLDRAVSVAGQQFDVKLTFIKQ